MKKFIMLFFSMVFTFASFANTTKIEETSDGYLKCDISVGSTQTNFEETADFYDFLYTVIQKAQNTNKKVVITYNGKWKYVFKNTEAIIASDVITAHFLSGATFGSSSWYNGMKKVFDVMKNDKNILVTIR